MSLAFTPDDKIVLFGGAGLVGQNLLFLLRDQACRNIVVIDRHAHNLAVLRQLHPQVTAIEADMAAPGAWQEAVQGATVAVMLQAQIGGTVAEAFTRNSLDSTRHALAALQRHAVPRLVHISSSVVNSLAVDAYTESKKAQEALVRNSGLAYTVLRPTLMFGWFDRKHLGWLARFMARQPVFPIPGSGRYMRQPLYVMDFCRIILACMQREPDGQAWDITGLEKIDYIDIIRTIRRVTGARTRIVHIPYALFWLLLKTYALFSADPPFTTAQLKALVTPDEFAVIAWGERFGVRPTPFAEALHETLCGEYSTVTLEF